MVCKKYVCSAGLEMQEDSVSKARAKVKYEEICEQAPSVLVAAGDLPPDNAELAGDQGAPVAAAALPGREEQQLLPNSREPAGDDAGFSNCPDLSSDHLFSPGKTGLKRHKIIVASCLLVSASILAFSMLDLRDLLVQEFVLESKTLKMSAIPKAPELPPNMSYLDRTIHQPGEWRVVLESTWQGDRAGYADEKGKIVISPKFGMLGRFCEGLASASMPTEGPRYMGRAGRYDGGNDGSTLHGFINEKGDWVIKPRFLAVKEFKNGIAAVLGRDEQSGADFAGLINKKGDFLFAIPSLLLPEPAGDNYIVSQDGKYGLINKEGKYLLPLEYDTLTAVARDSGPADYCSDIDWSLDKRDPGYLFGKKDKMSTCFSLDGKELAPSCSEPLNYTKNPGSYQIVRKSGKIGISAVESGDFLIEPLRSTDVFPYDEMILFLDKRLEPFDFEGKRQFYDRYHWRAFDWQGKEFKELPSNWSPVSRRGRWFQDGLAPVCIGGHVGYIDSKCRLVIPAKFDFGLPFTEGLASVWIDKSWRIINRKGEYVFEKEFPLPVEFFKGKATTLASGPLSVLLGGLKREYQEANVASWTGTYFRASSSVKDKHD